MDKLFGVDISEFQGDFDFQKAKSEGVKFVILRGALGKRKDNKFERNYKAAKECGLPVGVYQYSFAKTIKEAEEEADYLYNEVLKGKQFELPIYYDVEDNVHKPLNKQLLTSVVKTWCNNLESKKYFVGVYSFKSFFDSNFYDDELQRYTHWVAQWSKECNYSKLALGMWQFGGETNLQRTNKVADVVCDQNYLFVDFPTIIKNGGFNGFAKSTAAGTTAAKPIEKKLSVGCKVKVKKGAKDFTGHMLAAFVYDREHIVSELSGDRAVITFNGIVVAAMKTADLIIL